MGQSSAAMTPPPPVNTAPVSGLVRRLPLGLKIAALIFLFGVLLVYGHDQFSRRLAIVKPIQYVGHADSAAYAQAGDSIAHGDGFTVRFISEFFIPYSPDITRRDDHWPPFLGYSIASCIYFLGKSAWAAKIPPIFYATIALPLTTAFLAYALSRRGYIAIIAGMLMLMHAEFYEQSLVVLSDISAAMLVTGFCASLVFTRRHPWAHLLVAVFLACAYFAKGSQLILFPLYPVLAMLCAGPGVFIRKHFYMGLTLALLLVAPYWYGNWRAYGSPVHSVQNYVSGYYGLAPQGWDYTTYFPYWGHNLPKTSDRWNKYGDIYWTQAALNREFVARFAVTGNTDAQQSLWLDFGRYGAWFRDWLLPAPAVVPQTPRSIFSIFSAPSAPPATAAIRPIAKWYDTRTELPAAGAFLLLIGLVAAAPFTFAYRIIKWRQCKRAAVTDTVLVASPVESTSAALAPSGDSAAVWRSLRASPAASGTAALAPRLDWMLGPVIALFLLMVVEGGFIAYFWDVHQGQSRFCYLFIPIFAALGITAASRFIEWPLHFLLFLLRTAFTRFTKARIPALLTATAHSWHHILTLLTAIVLLARFSTLAPAMDKDTLTRLKAQGRGQGYPFSDDPTFPQAGAWIAKNLPHAVIMCRNPWQLAFHAGPDNKTICLPNAHLSGDAGAAQILAIAHYYKATHFYADDSRPQLAPYLNGQKPGFKRVPGVPFALFEIDWTKIPTQSPDAICLGK